MVPTIGLLLSLGLDTFAVAVGLGIGGLPHRRWAIVGLTFAVFESVMPAVGLVIGGQLSVQISVAATYVAGIILVGLGGRAVREAVRDGPREHDARPFKLLAGSSLLLAGLSVSLDELAVGFSLGMLHVPVLPGLAYIALRAFGVTFVGLTFGARATARIGERAAIVAGLVLAATGLTIILVEVIGVRL